MNSAEYQITIKSANQKVDDYVLDCKSTWTVQRLKQHSSETHVNKPNIEDQRLIYAGNLLKDTLTLKQVFFRDSLCTELTNSSKTDFTIHVVCSTQLQKASTSQHDSNAKGIKKNPRTTQVAGPPASSSDRPTTSALPNANPESQHESSSASTTTATSSNNARSSNVTQAPSGPSPQAAEVAMNLLQSDHMRQQTAIFQQLANMVAAQLIQNLANGLIMDSTQIAAAGAGVGTSSDQAIQFPDITPLLNSQTMNLQTLTTTTTTTTVATQSDGPNIAGTVAPQVLYTGSRLPNPLVTGAEGRDAALVATPRNEQNLHADNHANAREVVINHQPGGPLMALGVQPPQAAGAVAAAAVVAQPPAQAPIIEQPPPAPAVNPDVPIIQHDVIDWVYYLIRAMILMAALYIHASLFRLLFIVVLLAIAYFFNRRTARRDARNQHQEPGQVGAYPRQAAARGQGAAEVANENVNMDGAADVAADQPQEQQEAPDAELRRRRGVNPDGTTDRINEGENDPRDDTVQQNVAHRPISFLKLIYLVVTDFLASLVPE